MDILVMLEEGPERSPVLAHVNSAPSPLDSDRPPRDVVTLYGDASPETLALALAAAVESHRVDGDRAVSIRHLGIWRERGAVGDAAWRDEATGALVTRDLDIPFAVLNERAAQLLADGGQVIRRLAAGLAMPDWPEGARRAINVSLTAVVVEPLVAGARLEGMLEMMREADGLAFDYEGD
ncbi:MAG TPA: hypothetical protein VNA89_01385 [Gemmatimonadaceae bacterium]|nr:hypothetical protein [Gemmatimonadaceae bacterium]